MTIEVTLYTKPGCHLCEQALADLARLQRRFPHELRLVDITVEPELMRDYGERIPVLSINGREQGAPLPAAVLEREMRRASGGDD